MRNASKKKFFVLLFAMMRTIECKVLMIQKDHKWAISGSGEFKDNLNFCACYRATEQKFRSCCEKSRKELGAAEK